MYHKIDQAEIPQTFDLVLLNSLKNNENLDSFFIFNYFK